MNKRKISIRNLFIALMAIFIIIGSTEAVLTLKNKEPEKYDSVRSENGNLLLLQFESMGPERFFTSATNVYNAKQTYETLEFVPEFQYEYPLIDITKDTAVDDALNIVVIGDSFVWGAYSLNRNELFWRVLENNFRKDGVRVNVYGVGTTGANAYEELSWLTDYSLIEDLDPDLVVFGYVYNDSDDSIDIDGGLVNWDEELPLLSKLKAVLPNIYKALIERISARTMYSDKYSDLEYVSYDGAPPVLKGRFYEKYKTDFVEKLDAFAATVDFPIAVVTLPTQPHNAMLEALYKPLKGLYASCENISYYNSMKEFNSFASSKHSKNYSVNIADFHPGSATNSFYADYIKDFIEKDYPDLLEKYENKYEESSQIIINEYLPYGVSPVRIAEDEASAVYSVTYPVTSEPNYVRGIELSEYYLCEPLGKEHIKLSFSDAVKLEEVTLSGEYDEVELYYTCINEKLGYDDHEIHDFEKSKNGSFIPEKDAEITSLLISAVFGEEDNRQIEITLRKSEGAAG